MLVVMAIAAMLFLARYDDPRRIASGDSFWYMRQALIYTGVSPGEAGRQAAQQVCQDINRSQQASHTKPSCRSYVSTGFAPRYVAIFGSRPGYPLFAAPFVAVLGAWTGMMAATMILALLAAVLAYLAVWLASGLRLGGVLAAAILFVLPSGFAMTRMLTESGVLAGYLAVVLGGTLLLRGRRLGLPIIIVALAWLFPLRSASGMAMALTLVAAGVVAMCGRPHRRPGAMIAAAGAAAAVGWQVLSAGLHLPGLDDTIQDFATRHFRLGPDVPDPIGWLLGRNLTFWPERLAPAVAVPAAVVAVLFAVAVLLLRMRTVAALWIFSGLTGVLMVVAHPLDSEYVRLMVPIWLPVSCAFGYAAALALGRRPVPATAAQPAVLSPAPPATPPPPAAIPEQPRRERALHASHA